MQQPGQPADLGRGGQSIGLERFHQFLQERRLEWLAFQSAEQLREQDEVVRPLIDGGQDRSNAAGNEMREHAVERQDDEQREEASIPDDPADERGGAEHAQDRRDDERPSCRGIRAGSCPQAARAAGSMPPRTSTPSSSRSSRRSSRGRSSATAACRCRIVRALPVRAATRPAPPRRPAFGPCTGARRANPRRRGRDRPRRDARGRETRALAPPGRPIGPRAAPVPWRKSRRPCGPDRRPAGSARERAPARRIRRRNGQPPGAGQRGRGRSRSPDTSAATKKTSRASATRRSRLVQRSSARFRSASRTAVDRVKIVTSRPSLGACCRFNHVVLVPSRIVESDHANRPAAIPQAVVGSSGDCSSRPLVRRPVSNPVVARAAIGLESCTSQPVLR